jgi:hypothetical protein
MKFLHRFKKSRVQYWSNSKFAGWIRGTPKPEWETGEGWNKWNKNAKKSHPFRYWFAEEALNTIPDIVHLPLDMIYSLKYYINNRWVTKTHSLTAHPRDIPRGQWRDVGNRFLPCLFNELVDFVEVEQAWHNIAWDKEARLKYNPPFYAWGWFRWRTWRCPEAGLDYLRWAASLRHNDEWVDVNDPHYNEPTPQAINAQEIMALYDWWKNVYPQRKDPMELSGWSDLCDQRRQRAKALDPDSDELSFLDGDKTEEEKAETSRVLDLSNEIEQQQEDEDTEMLIRLIKVRRSLWT